MQQLDNPKMLFIDLFAGAGGATTGIEHAQVFENKAAKVIACVNHDKNAIASHLANHPHCMHMTEDIRTVAVIQLVKIALKAKEDYPLAKLYMWASLECTNFSRAKGGLPRDADSRTLAEHLFRYFDAFISAGIPFDGIFIENVEEFMSWGPLDKNGRPTSKDKGRDYANWVNDIKNYGYNYDYRILNAADFGAYTSRKRYFGVFMRPWLPMVWPLPTNSKKMMPGLAPWKPVREVLDLNITGKNVFGRPKDLAEATLERIWEGLKKHIHETHNGAFLDYYYGNGYSSTIDRPSGTLTTKDRINVVHFLLFPQWGPRCSHSIDKPSPVLPARMDKMCPYVIDAQIEPAVIEIKESDSFYTKKIKEFMIERGIMEVRMRGLSIPEMLRITGLDENYTLVGTIAERKKYIGNAVPVKLAQALIESFAAALIQPLDNEKAA